MPFIPVYEWHLPDGTVMGCGSQAEFDHWLAEGVTVAGSYLGTIIGHEPASEDDRRQIAWAA